MKELLFSLFFISVFLTGFSAASADPIQISATVVDLTKSKVLYDDHADLRLVPASTTKLFVAATALRQLGSNYQFTTPIYIRGTLSQGVLQGDLILYGVGDPALTNEKLWALTNQLQQLGLKQIKGNLIINNNYLGAIITDNPDRILAQTMSPGAYNSLLSSAGSDFGTVGLSIFPAAPGQLARSVVIPFNLANVNLSGKVLTTKDEKNSLTLKRISKKNQENLILSGTVNENSKPIVLYRSVGNPDVLTGNLFQGFLQQAGIDVSGNVIVENKALTKDDILLTTNEGDVLSLLLQVMLRTSNNYMADMITLDMWRQQQATSPEKTDVSVAAQNLVSEYQKIAQLSSFENKQLGLPVLHNGSGLTLDNNVSAHDLIVLLDGMYHDTTNFPVFQGALVNFGEASYWRSHLTSSQLEWANRLMSKTGTLYRPTAVLGLAGYFRLKNGDQAAFALLLNQTGIKNNSQNKLPPEFLSQLNSLFAEKF